MSSDDVKHLTVTFFPKSKFICNVQWDEDAKCVDVLTCETKHTSLTAYLRGEEHVRKTYGWNTKYLEDREGVYVFK